MGIRSGSPSSCSSLNWRNDYGGGILNMIPSSYSSLSCDLGVLGGETDTNGRVSGTHCCLGSRPVGDEGKPGNWSRRWMHGHRNMVWGTTVGVYRDTRPEINIGGDRSRHRDKSTSVRIKTAAPGWTYGGWLYHITVLVDSPKEVVKIIAAVLQQPKLPGC